MHAILSGKAEVCFQCSFWVLIHVWTIRQIFFFTNSVSDLLLFVSVIRTTPSPPALLRCLSLQFVLFLTSLSLHMCPITLCDKEERIMKMKIMKSK